MTEFKTPTSKKYKSRVQDNPELCTPIKIPASPFLKKIGYGCGVNVFSLERSPKVGFIRSPWAIKKRNRKIEDRQYSNRIRFEAEVLSKLKHPNIVGFRAFTEVSNEPCLMMEKLDCSLGDMIEKKVEVDENPFPAEDIMKITYEVLKGLEYLHHTAHILHGDVKSFNVLISKDYTTVKLCDFGVSLPLTESLELDNTKGELEYVGTECWNAPEIVFGNGPVTNKADIWACGLVIWEMIALSPPHVCDSEEDESHLEDSVSEMQCTKTNDVSMDSMNDSSYMNELESMNNRKYGTRPPLPAIDLGKEYQMVLELFFTCTTSDYKFRPSAKRLVNFFKDVYKSK